VPLPPLSPGQRAAALAAAAAARTARAQAKADLKSGRLTLAELLERADRDAAVAKLRVSTVLESLPGVGRVRAAGLMADLGAAPGRRLRGLGARQRQHLLRRVAAGSTR